MPHVRAWRVAIRFHVMARPDAAADVPSAHDAEARARKKRVSVGAVVSTHTRPVTPVTSL